MSAATTQTSERQPVLYLSHGAPPLADDSTWTGELAAWSSDLPRPSSVLIVSAHWEMAPIAVSATSGDVPLLYDFWGFPQRLLRGHLRRPGGARAGAVGGRVALRRRREPAPGPHAWPRPRRLRAAEGDVPRGRRPRAPAVDADPGPAAALRPRERLAPLRDEGVLIVGSGFTTHNLAWFNPSAPSDAAPPTPSAEFDHWAAEAVGRGDVDAVLDFLAKAPAAREAHPRTEHWAPLYVALGAASASGGVDAASVIDGFWYGLSKRSWQFA